MPSDAGHLALLDIRDNVLLAKAFVEGFTRDSFKGDRRTFYAVTRCLEIISEAARRLPEAVRSQHPALPWRAIMGAGNVYRHEYDNVAEDFVWRTVHHSLDPLLAMAEAQLAAGDGLP
jgi:uncharacterized protein with HEPN domain